MSNSDFDDSPDEIRRAPPRAPQTRRVAKKKKPVRRAAVRAPEPEYEEEEARVAQPLRRNAPRPPTRSEGTRDTNRDPARSNGRVVIGRGGEELARRRTAVGDKFEIPKAYCPQGWTYQWNAVTILNQGIQEIVRGDLQMHENGWRPVPASRHPGHWTPQGYEGSIILDGLRLEERPESLTKDALAEDRQRAGAQVRDRTDALRLTQRALPGANVASQRNNAGGMRMSIDPALDIPRPQHEIEE